MGPPRFANVVGSKVTAGPAYSVEPSNEVPAKLKLGAEFPQATGELSTNGTPGKPGVLSASVAHSQHG